MELTREQKRLLMLHEYKLSEKPNAAETARRINKAWGESTVGESTVRTRFAEFKNGNEDLAHQQGAVRPKEIDRQAVLEAIEETPSSTTRMLADDFECSHTAIENILHELGKVWKKTRWVPHELTQGQKNKRMNCAQTLLDRQEEVPFLDQLDDNAKPHRSNVTNAKVRELGWDRLDHPPYSPDLAPSDFHLFRSLQHFLKGKRFDSIEEMQESLEEFFDSKDADFYRRGIEKLPEKWQEVIEVDGEYFD